MGSELRRLARAFSLILLFALPCMTLAAERPRIGLVLGGGGARGAAHVGVLRVLERERIPVDAIAGTSMGAVVGGLYAAGYSPDEIEAILLGLDWRELLRDDPPRIDLPMRRKDADFRYLLDARLGFRDGRIVFPQGAIQGQRLLLLLRRLVLPVWRIEDFDALPIPFRCVATDIGRGEAVVFERGDLALAMRASLSVPAAIAPLRVDGRLLVDGGITDNVPVDVARAMGVDRLIVVDVSEPLLAAEALESPLDITLQMITALMAQRTAERLRTLGADDVLLRPALADFASTEFGRMQAAIPDGVAAAEAALPALRALALSEAAWDRHQAPRRRPELDAPLVEFLALVREGTRAPAAVEERVRALVGAPLDVDALEKGLASSYGTGGYERIGWRLIEREGRTGLEVAPVDKGWGPNYLAFGLRVSDDFEGRSDYELDLESTVTGVNALGAEWRTQVGVGRVTQARTEFYQPFGEFGRWFAQPYLDYRAQQQPLRLGAIDLAEYRLRRARLGFELGYTPDPVTEWRTGLLRGHTAATLRVGDPTLVPARESSSFGAVTLGYTRDTLDEAEFPSQGTRLDADFEVYRAGFGGTGDGEVLRTVVDHATSAGVHRWLMGASFATHWGEPDLFQRAALLGGFTNLSGFGERELVGEHALLGRVVYYRSLGAADALFSVPTYLGASLEAGNVFDRRSDIDLGALVLAGSLFVGVDTLFGPAFLGFGVAETGDTSFYLNFGTLLRRDP